MTADDRVRVVPLMLSIRLEMEMEVRGAHPRSAVA